MAQQVNTLKYFHKSPYLGPEPEHWSPTRCPFWEKRQPNYGRYQSCELRTNSPFPANTCPPQVQHASIDTPI